jgi:hypothetical protein
VAGVATHPIKQVGAKSSEAATGAVTLIQRFGSAANLNIHIHGLVLDGVYHTGAEGAPESRPAPALTGEKLQALQGKIITRVLRRLTRLVWWIRLLRFAKQHHSLQAPIAFIESHRCNASRHSNVYCPRIEKPQLPCCARDGRCA